MMGNCGSNARHFLHGRHAHHLINQINQNPSSQQLICKPCIKGSWVCSPFSKPIYSTLNMEPLVLPQGDGEAADIHELHLYNFGYIVCVLSNNKNHSTIFYCGVIFVEITKKYCS